MVGKVVLTSYGAIPVAELKNSLPPDFPKIPLDFSLQDLTDAEADKTNKIQFAKETGTKKIFRAKPAKPTVLPKYLDPKLAYFIGYFYGDGGLKDVEKSHRNRGKYEYKLKIADEFLIQIQRIQTLLFELFGLNAPIRYERILKGERTYYLNPTNKVLYRFLTKIFGLPCGKKGKELGIPKIMKKAPTELVQWFVRGFFDADGETRAVEAGFNSQSRVKVRLKSNVFVLELKDLIEKTFSVSVNGPYFDKGFNSSYIQIERQKDIVSLYHQQLFLHPIKRWRLNQTASFLLVRSKDLKKLT